MPRCDTCYAMRSSAEVRKLPGRDAYRCKDKWQCLLAESKREPWTVTFAITYPARDEIEAHQIAKDLPKQLEPLPVKIVGVEPEGGWPAHEADLHQTIDDALLADDESLRLLITPDGKVVRRPTATT